MNQGLRRFWAATVLLGGIGAALAFRHPAPRDQAPWAGGTEKLVLRKQVGPAGPAAPRPESPLPVPPAAAPTPPATPAPAAPDPVPAKPTTIGPLDTGQAPPPLAAAYPYGQAAPAPGAAPAPVETALRRHRVADGDTLEALAERYLGSAALAMEVYEANRDVLASPQLLPIGAELAIPPRNARRVTSLEAIRAGTLAPIPPRP